MKAITHEPWHGEHAWCYAKPNGLDILWADLNVQSNDSVGGLSPLGDGKLQPLVSRSNCASTSPSIWVPGSVFMKISISERTSLAFVERLQVFLKSSNSCQQESQM